jgi:5'-methylthioadenosine phosphorylase
MAPHADVVGMTIAAECVVAGELGLEYAALCMVDNLANGLGEGTLSVAAMEADRVANAARLRDGLGAVLPRLGAVGR